MVATRPFKNVFQFWLTRFRNARWDLIATKNPGWQWLSMFRVGLSLLKLVFCRTDVVEIAALVC